MNFDKPENITLETIGGGAAVEKFGLELDEVIKNIKDVNYPAGEKRVIDLKITLKPSEDRNYVTSTIECGAKLPKRKAFNSGMYVGLDEHGNPVASENMPQQQTFSDLEKLKSSDNITHLQEAK